MTHRQAGGARQQACTRETGEGEEVEIRGRGDVRW